MLEELLRHYGLGGMYYEGPKDGGSGRMTQPQVEEEGPSDGMSLEEFTEQRLASNEGGGDGEEPEPEPEPQPEEPEEPDESGEEDEPDDDAEKLEPDYDEDAEPEDGDGEDEPEEGGDEEETEGGEDDYSPEGEDDFYYDPEKFKEENEIDRDVPHTNKFPDRESAIYAAINKASMIKDALEELQDLGQDHGALPLPDALKGDLDNLDTLENAEQVADMDDSELTQFLWESDEFRHRVQDKAERVQQKKESAEVSQQFEQLQESLYEGLADILGGEDKITQEFAQKLDQGKEQGRKVLNEQIENRIEQELKPDVEAIEEFIDSDEAEDMSRQKFAQELQAKKDALAEKEQSLRDQFSDVVNTYEEAYELAPKVQEAKPKTEAEKVTQAYNSLDVWQEDAKDFSNLLIDDPGAKRELEAFVKNAMRNREKFNDLQHPSDWNEAEEWWHNEFKPKIRSKRQKEKINGDKKKSSSSKKKDKSDDIDEPDPSKQEEMRRKEGDDVYSMNQSNLDSLVQETDAA